MAITLRQVKGSPLTFTEVDNNFSELDTTKLENVVEDTTPQLGGNLDVQANSITTSTTDGDIDIQPNGTGDVVLGNYAFDGDQTVGATEDNYGFRYDHSLGQIVLKPHGSDLIASGTASSVAALNFTGLTSDYRRYQLVIRNATVATDTANMLMQVSTDNGATYVTTASYHWAMQYARIRSTGGSASGNEGGWADTSIQILNNMGTVAGEEAAGIIDIFDPVGTDDYTRISTRMQQLNAVPEARTSSTGGQYNATTSVDAFRIIASTGNIATISYQLFGYR